MDKLETLENRKNKLMRVLEVLSLMLQENEDVQLKSRSGHKVLFYNKTGLKDPIVVAIVRAVQNQICNVEESISELHNELEQ